jgi:uncharacterized glyoxalase superfamily protein PhnB
MTSTNETTTAPTTTSTDRPPTSVWACLTYTDALAAADFLERAFGFERTAVYTRDGDDSIVEHAEMRWPKGGGIMFGTAGKDDTAFGRRAPGGGAVYVVCDDPDALYERAVAAGAEVLIGLTDTDYGSRDFSVRDPEGNIWSFGTYAGA